MRYRSATLGVHNGLKVETQLTTFDRPVERSQAFYLYCIPLILRRLEGGIPATGTLDTVHGRVRGAEQAVQLPGIVWVDTQAETPVNEDLLQK